MNNNRNNDSDGRIRKQDSMDLTDDLVDEICTVENTETNETER